MAGLRKKFVSVESDEAKPALELIQRELNAGAKIVQVAEKIGVSRSTLSQIINRCGLYGTGKASIAAIVAKTMASLGTYECPHMQQAGRAEYMVTGVLCRAYAYREPPTNNATEIRHWRACQECPKRPPAVQIQSNQPKREKGEDE